MLSQNSVGGVRPIAIGNSLRRLAEKIGMLSINGIEKELFWPHQVGVGVPLGGEIACHAIREFVSNPLNKGKFILKTDFQMLTTV